jgi:hypothetical protein
MMYYCEAWLYQPFHPHPIIWHNGGTSGNKTMVAFMPEAGLGIVVLSNLITDLPEALAFKFFDLYFHNQTRDWSKMVLDKTKKSEADEKPAARSESPSPTLPLERYAGTFSNPVYGRITIIREQDKLFIVIGLNKRKELLRPFNRDSFSFDWADEFTSVVFAIGPDGRAQSSETDYGNGQNGGLSANRHFEGGRQRDSYNRQHGLAQK